MSMDGPGLGSTPQISWLCHVYAHILVSALSYYCLRLTSCWQAGI